MDAAIGAMIGQGLRAQLATSTPVIGGPVVALRFVPGAKPATLVPGSPPEIPSVSGSSVDRIVSEAGDVMAKVDAMPLPQIAEDLHRTTARVADITNSPELADSLRNLDRSLANVSQITAEARKQVAPVLAQLHKAADQAEATLASARSLLGNAGTAQNSVQTAGLPATLYELTRAARSLRELSDYLDRHPEALLQGKGKSG
jgi:paraquat-inducible protein B